MKKNDKHLTNEDIRCQTAIAHLAMLRATGGIRHRALRQLWRISTSPLAGGKYADKSQAILNRIVTPMFLAQQFMPPKPPRLPNVPNEYAIFLGTEVNSPHRKVYIHRNMLTRHGIIVGQNGTGKSRLMLFLVDRIMRHNIERNL